MIEIGLGYGAQNAVILVGFRKLGNEVLMNAQVRNEIGIAGEEIVGIKRGDREIFDASLGGKREKCC